MAAIKDLPTLLRQARPELQKGRYYVSSIDEAALITLPTQLQNIAGIYCEKEGVSLIANAKLKPFMKKRSGGKISGPFALITLKVHSDLLAVGFMAAIAGALARKNIACNCVSAYYHDHLLVPWER